MLQSPSGNIHWVGNASAAKACAARGGRCLLPTRCPLAEMQVVGGASDRNWLLIGQPELSLRVCSLLTTRRWPGPPRLEPSPVPALSLPTALSDPAAKENCMMHLLRSLPDPNLITFLFLLEHLKR